MIHFSKEKGFISPEGIKFRVGQDVNIKLPSVAVGMFSRHLFQKVIENYQCYEVGYLSVANMERNVYILEYDNIFVTLFMAGVGGPLIASDIEDLHVSGVSTFIIFGNCGVLDKEIADCSIIVPTLAYREDGVSYHYQEENDTILMNPKFKKEFKEILNKYHITYREGPTWTTDAFYRETKEKVCNYKQKGVLSVEMEGSAIAAVCTYLNIDYFTFYYAGDNLDSVSWEKRSISGEIELDKKQEVVKLALELAKKISS